MTPGNPEQVIAATWLDSKIPSIFDSEISFARETLKRRNGERADAKRTGKRIVHSNFVAASLDSLLSSDPMDERGRSARKDKADVEAVDSLFADAFFVRDLAKTAGATI